MRRRVLRDAGVVAIATLCGAGLALADSDGTTGTPTWRTIVNIGDAIPGSDTTYRSFNQPSINRDGVVVFRARGAGPSEPIRGIYLRRMGMPDEPIEVIVQRGDEVPDPNNTETMPGSGELAFFLEFPSIPRIDAFSDVLATRGQHRPVWTYPVGDGEETRVGTAGVYVLQAGELGTAASQLGSVLDVNTGEPVFPEYAVPGMPEGTRFDQFPGSPTVDAGTIAFKGNFIDPATESGKTGVYFLSYDAGPAGVTQRIASSDTLIPGAPAGITFGSTAPPSAAGGRITFVGLDVEDAPTLGGIYVAPLEPDPPLVAIASIGGAVPGEAKGEGFTRLGEALAFDGRFISFWGAWGDETRTITLECPEDGNPALIAYCQEQYPDGFTVEIPVHQGIFVHDLIQDATFRIARTSDDPGGITDFLYWVFSGRVPGTGGGKSGEEEVEEPARWRNSAFSAVATREVATDGAAPIEFEVAFKARRGDVDGIYVVRGSHDDEPMIAVLTTAMPGRLIDLDAPEDSRITALGLEREGLRGEWLGVAASMFDEVSGESWAGMYLARSDEIVPCEGDFGGDGFVGGEDLGQLLTVWGACDGCIEDLNGDGVVDGEDLGALIAVWGPCW